MDISILDSFDDLESDVRHFGGVYQAKKEALESLRDDIKELAKEEKILIKVQKTITHLMDNLVQKDMAKMDTLVNYGLEIVFPDRDISFKSDLKDTGKKFYIDLNTIDQGEKLSGDSFGSEPSAATPTGSGARFLSVSSGTLCC